jgi:hypothetical protein
VIDTHSTDVEARDRLAATVESVESEGERHTTRHTTGSWPAYERLIAALRMRATRARHLAQNFNDPKSGNIGPGTKQQQAHCRHAKRRPPYSTAPRYASSASLRRRQ